METLLTTGLQLGIGGLSVAGIIYVSLEHAKTMKKVQEDFLKALEGRADKHEAAMKERETALRNVESSMRETLIDQIQKNTSVLLDVAKVLGRVVRFLDEGK